MPMNRTAPARAFALLGLLCCFAAGCTPLRQPVHVPPPPQETAGPEAEKAAQVWQRFVTQADTAEVISGPFRISANLRYTDTAGKSTRVSSLLWGNGKADNPYPLRLDLLAGVGTVVAKAREDNDSFLVFSPDEKTAYFHDGHDRTLASFGVPVPLSLSDLTLLLIGRGGVLFIPPRPDNDSGVPAEYSLTADGVSYVIRGARLPGILELSSLGAPVSWKEERGTGWSIGIEPGELNPLQPKRLRISHPKGYSALIIVKDMARVSPPYTSAQLGLVLPEGTERKPLE